MGKNYIGGTPQEARIKYLKQNPDLLSTIKEISQRYQLNPSLLLYRLSKEGIVDSKIKDYNAEIDSEKINSTNLDKADAAFQKFGTDWLAHRIKSGNVKLNRVIPFTSREVLNEKDELVKPAHFFTNYDNIEGVAAQLKQIESEVNKDFQNQDINKDAAIMAYYNRGRSGGKSYIKTEGNKYLQYQIPQEYQQLLVGISPAKTPVINYAESEGFRSLYNFINNQNTVPLMTQKHPKSVWDLTQQKTDEEIKYLDEQKDKQFKNWLGITKQQADSIMSVPKFSSGKFNYLNFFK